MGIDCEQLNPIGGQGGNSAIEDAACLANQLYGLVSSERVDGRQTESAIDAAFAKTQELRCAREGSVEEVALLAENASDGLVGYGDGCKVCHASHGW